MPATESLLRERVEQSAFTISVIDDIDRFGSLRTEWKDLLRSSSSNNPFLTWEWLHAWWKHLNGGRTLQILDGYRSEVYRLIGVAPLCVSRGRLPGLSQLEFLGTGWAGSDYLDLIARRGYERDTVDAFADWFESRAKTVRFDHLRPVRLPRSLGDRLAGSGWGRDSGHLRRLPIHHAPGAFVGKLPRDAAPLTAHALPSLSQYASQEIQCDLRARRDRGTAARRALGAHELSRSALDTSWRVHSVSDAGTSIVPPRRHIARAQLRLAPSSMRSVWTATLRRSRIAFTSTAGAICTSTGFNPRFWQYSVGVVVLGLTIHAAIDEGAAGIRPAVRRGTLQGALGQRDAAARAD